MVVDQVELQTHLVQMVLQLLEDLVVVQEVLIQLHLEEQRLPLVKEMLEDLVEIVQDVILHHQLVVVAVLVQ